MKWTPPTKRSDECMPHHSSEPDLTSSKTTEQTLDRITIRQKRQHGSEQIDELNSLREDIMSSIQTLRKEQGEKFSTMQNNLDQIKTQNEGLLNTVQFLNSKYDDLVVKLTQLENKRKNTLEYITILEEKVENLERNAKSSSLEIRNVLKINNESNDNLINIVKSLGNVFNTEIQTYEIRDVYRINSNKNPQTAGPITAEFTSNITKDKQDRQTNLSNIKKHNHNHTSNRLNSSHFKMAGNTPVFVSESLTTKTKKLYYQAREFSKQYAYAYHWTSHGKDYIKKKDGAPTKRITHESDFENLKQQEK